MRITVLANRDVHSCLALNLLAPVLRGHEVTLLLSDAVGSSAPVLAPLALLKRAEQGIANESLFPYVESLGEETRQELQTFRQLANAWGRLPQRFNAPNTAEGLATLRAAAPDLLLSVRYGKRLQPAAIAVAPRGALNLHSGLLPEYRGVLATMRALLAGEKTIGCTLHWITDAEIDTGAVIATSSTPVLPATSLFDAIHSVYPAGCAVLTRIIERIAAGGMLATVPQGEEGNYYTWPGEEEFARLAALGHSVVNIPSWSAHMRRFLPAQSSFEIPEPGNE